MEAESLGDRYCRSVYPCAGKLLEIKSILESTDMLAVPICKLKGEGVPSLWLSESTLLIASKLTPNDFVKSVSLPPLYVLNEISDLSEDWAFSIEKSKVNQPGNMV